MESGTTFHAALNATFCAARGNAQVGCYYLQNRATFLSTAHYFCFYNILNQGDNVGDQNGWTTALFLPGEHLLKKNNLLGTLPTLAKEWKISFEFKPKSYNRNGFSQILHLTIGGKGIATGERTPALWIYKKNGVAKVWIKTALNGKPNEGDLSDKKPPPVNKWSKVEISQVRKRNPVGSQGSYYVFSLVIGGEIFMYEENNSPTKFSNAKVYASSGWYPAQAGSIRGLKIETKQTGEPTSCNEDMILCKLKIDVSLKRSP